MPALPAPPTIPGAPQPSLGDAALLARVAALESRVIALERMIGPAPGGGIQITAPGNLRLAVGGSCTVAVGLNLALTVGGGVTLTATKELTATVQSDATLTVGKQLTAVAGDALTMRSGGASHVLRKNGDIAITGKDIEIRGSGPIVVKSSANVAIKGSKILQN